MRTFLITLLISSATMSMLALIYMAITPLLEKRYSRKWLYYTWLLILIWLLVPLRPQVGVAAIRIDIPIGNECE